MEGDIFSVKKQQLQPDFLKDKTTDNWETRKLIMNLWWRCMRVVDVLDISFNMSHSIYQLPSYHALKHFLVYILMLVNY